MKRMKKLFLAAILILTLTVSLTACVTEIDSVTIKGEENIELAYGESVTLEATVSPEKAKNKSIKWTVIETNLDGEYTLSGSKFTAKQKAGYAVVQATSKNGKTDFVTIVINPEIKTEVSDSVKVTFYAVDGSTVIDVLYVEKNSTVTPPDYAIVDSDVYWVDANGNRVDFSSLVLTEDLAFIAKAEDNSVYYTITYWYYNDSGVPVQQGTTYKIEANSGSTVPKEDVEAIEAAVESATGKTVINWSAVISDDGFTISWYAEFKPQ